jgi:hypothetical protein
MNEGKMKSENTPDGRRLAKDASGRVEVTISYDAVLVANVEAGGRTLGQHEVYGEVRM